MSLIHRVFGTKRRAPQPVKTKPTPVQSAASAQNAGRREVLRVGLRDSLIRHGIPKDWVGLEIIQTHVQGKEHGLHLRLLLKHWEPRLLTHSVAFQSSVAKRVALLDPHAPEWLAGISWQFALEDEAKCPPLPHPDTWTAQAPLAQAAPAAASAARATIAPVAELNRLFAENDALRNAQTSATGAGFSVTQHMFRPTEPAGLTPD